MDGRRREDRGFAGIIAMLMALAALAERAAARSFPVRFLVLVLLRRAESAARAFVLEATGIDSAFLEDPTDFGAGALDAAWLAWRFRVLAAALSALTGRPCCPDRRKRCDRASRSAPRRLDAARVGLAPEPNDTS